ncbi:MAG: tetratricopeptide repeat protein, partial [Planctomycetota bacterium]
MMMTGPSRTIIPGAAAISLLLLLVLGAAPIACSREPDRAATARTTWTVPDPDRSSMQPQVSRALGAARDAVMARPDSAAAWGHYAALLDAHELDALALPCYERAQRLAPSDFRWPYLRANLMEQFDASATEIVEQYNQASRIEPSFPPTYFRIGEVLSRLGQLEAARDAYRRAIELDPDRLAIAHRSLGQVLLQIGDTPGALQHLQRADALAPGDRPTVVSLSQALVRLGRADEARAAAARSRSLDERLSLPDPVRYQVESMRLTIDACRDRAIARAAAGDAAGALAELTMLADVTSDDPYFYLQIGSAYLNIRRGDLAVFHFVRALRLDDQLPVAHVQLGIAYLSLRQPADAERHLRRAVELDESSAAAHARLGTALARQQRPDEAIARFRMASSLGTLDAESEAAWGTVLLQQGDAAASIDHFRTAVQLRPNYVGAHYNLGLALEQVGRR